MFGGIVNSLLPRVEVKRSKQAYLSRKWFLFSTEQFFYGNEIFKHNMKMNKSDQQIVVVDKCNNFKQWRLFP
jgi:hypothetical protein